MPALVALLEQKNKEASRTKSAGPALPRSTPDGGAWAGLPFFLQRPAPPSARSREEDAVPIQAQAAKQSGGRAAPDGAAAASLETPSEKRDDPSKNTEQDAEAAKDQKAERGKGKDTELVTRDGAAGEAEAPAKKKAPSAREAIAPTASAVRQRAAGARTHSKVDVPVGSAQAAALTPTTEKARGAAAATVKGMDAANADQVRREAFKRSLREAIDKATPQPKTENEAARVREQGATEASGVLRGELTTQRDAAAGPMKNAAKVEVTAESQPAQPETKLQPEPMGQPPAPVSAAAVVPPPLSAEQLDYSSDRAPTDNAMTDAGVTQEQLQNGNEPTFGAALESRSTAETHENKAEGQYRPAEAKVQDKAHDGAQAALAGGLGGMHGARGAQVGKVVAQQKTTQSKNAGERKRITQVVTGIKDQTKIDVDKILQEMDDEAAQVFEDGLTDAERVYEKVFDDEKGGVGTWLTTWGSDWEQLIEHSLGRARQAYLRRVDEAIDKVADCVDAKLKIAKQRVAAGRTQVEVFVAGLDDSVQTFGKEALESVSADFDALEGEIDQRRDALIDHLAQQYKASYERMSAMEDKLREENKSLWQRVYDATVGLIKKILAFKDMLLSVLAKAADVVGDIISDPIRFLGNLVSGVMLGLENFMGNIGAHLKKGLLDWLFGALGGAGIQLPETLDLEGIVSIALQVLGLTYANFRTRAVAIVGEPVVSALEQTAEVFKVLFTEGIPGLWRFIKEKLSDLQTMVLDAIFTFVEEKVIVAGITWVIGLLNPASAFFKACKAIYDIVMFFIERGSQILALVNAIIDSMASIAAGNIAVAANFVEDALAKTIPVAIGFLASLLGLGDISGEIRKIIDKAQAPINEAIDWVIHQAVKLVKAAGKLVGGLLGGEEDGDKEDKEGGPAEQVGKSIEFQADGESHKLWVDLSGDKATLMVASDTKSLMQYLDEAAKNTKITAIVSQAKAIAFKADVDADQIAKVVVHVTKAREKGLNKELTDKKKNLSDEETELAALLKIIFNEMRPIQKYINDAIGKVTEAPYGYDLFPDRGDYEYGGNYDYLEIQRDEGFGSAEQKAFPRVHIRNGVVTEGPGLLQSDFPVIERYKIAIDLIRDRLNDDQAPKFTQSPDAPRASLESGKNRARHFNRGIRKQMEALIRAIEASQKEGADFEVTGVEIVTGKRRVDYSLRKKVGPHTIEAMVEYKHWTGHMSVPKRTELSDKLEAQLRGQIIGGKDQFKVLIVQWPQFMTLDSDSRDVFYGVFSRVQSFGEMNGVDVMLQIGGM